MAKRYVQQDFGVSIVPRWAVDSEVRHAELEAWPVLPLDLFRTLALAVPARRALGRATEALVTVLREFAAATATGSGLVLEPTNRAGLGTLDRES